MSEVGLKELLQAGVHFGHQTHRWNPKMRRFIFAERGGIYLIDLKKTLRDLNRARDLVNGVVRGGSNVLFVCTKPQLKGLVRAEAERAGAFYVTERWLGGLLTNFQTIKKNIRRLKDLERGVVDRFRSMPMSRSALSAAGMSPPPFTSPSCAKSSLN